jgi:hypothetical protein
VSCLPLVRKGVSVPLSLWGVPRERARQSEFAGNGRRTAGWNIQCRTPWRTVRWSDGVHTRPHRTLSRWGAPPARPRLPPLLAPDPDASGSREFESAASGVASRQVKIMFCIHVSFFLLINVFSKIHALLKMCKSKRR